MPIYEYHCEPCEHTFETLIRGQGDTAHCPKCGGIELLKQFSVPAAAVPEPAAWALMILGFGGAGAQLRRRRRIAA